MITVRDAATGDIPAIRDLLVRCGLPEDDIDAGGAGFLVAVSEGRIVGTIALESYPPLGLLRSAAVEPGSRGRGIGRLLVEEILGKAWAGGLEGVVLLTTTAEKFFGEAGFRKIDRGTLAGPVLGSSQFSGTRCSSAAVMTITAGGTSPSGAALS